MTSLRDSKSLILLRLSDGELTTPKLIIFMIYMGSVLVKSILITFTETD